MPRWTITLRTLHLQIILLRRRHLAAHDHFIAVGFGVGALDDAIRHTAGAGELLGVVLFGEDNCAASSAERLHVEGRQSYASVIFVDTTISISVRSESTFRQT